MSNIKSPIIICGYPGGGTSYITKILRYSGMFAGVSTYYSEFEFYKSRFRETSLSMLEKEKHTYASKYDYNSAVKILTDSITFALNEEEINKIGQYHPVIGAKPNYLSYNIHCSFIQGLYEDYKKTNLKIYNKSKSNLLGDVNRTISPLEARKNHEHKMFQDLVNYLYALAYNLSFKGFKDIDYNLITNVHHLTLNQSNQFEENIKDDFFDIFFNNTPKNQIWGWKYPLNSTVIPVLKAMFGDPKFLFISKEYKSNNNPKSKGGKNFQDSTEMDREIYTNPPWLDESYNYKIINFEEVLTDWTKMKDMLQWLSLGATTSTGDPKDFNENDFKKLLKITKFEPKNI